MKSFVLILVIAGVAIGGWWLGRRPAADATGAQTSVDGGLPGPGSAVGSAVGSDYGMPALPPPGADTNRSGAIPAPGNSQGGTPVPAAAQADYAKAEALWADMSAKTPDDPTRDVRAVEAARLYSGVLRSTYGDASATAFADQLIVDRLAPLGAALFFSRNRYVDPLFATHTVVSGDVPDRISKSYGMSFQHLNLLRGRDPNDSNLRVGEVLKVIKLKEAGGSVLHVSKSNFRLDAFIGGVFVRRYDISTGAEATPTPVGKTEVTNLVFNPPWTSPLDGKVYPPGDPGNILGGVWIALAPDGIQGKNGIGLHGYTGEDQTLRKEASNGCMRLGNEQIKELAYVIAGPQRSPTIVEIVE